VLVRNKGLPKLGIVSGRKYLDFHKGLSRLVDQKSQKLLDLLEKLLAKVTLLHCRGSVRTFGENKVLPAAESPVSCTFGRLKYLGGGEDEN